MHCTVLGRRRHHWWAVVALATLVSPLGAREHDGAPTPVSPGGPPGDSASSACPTFSWSAAAGARGYELAVYRLGEDDQAPPDLVLRQRIEGAALAWTPPLDRCLIPGHRYGWAVRARHDAGDASWSAPRLFTVPAVGLPAGPDTDPAFATFRGRGGSDADPATPTVERPERSQPTRRARATGAPGGLRVSGPIVGDTFEGDGSALVNLEWQDLVGVPAGLDDGDDVIVYAAGNQLQLNATTFDVVEGPASGLDADLLDGLEGAAYALAADTYTQAEVDALLTVDNITAPVPAAPERLHFRPEPRDPGSRRLAWSMPSLAGVASFVVYQSQTPITDGNKNAAHRMVTGTLHAAVDLQAGSGLQHFRVEAIGLLGDPGPLSAELVIDTTRRLLYRADQRFDEVFELFVTRLDGSGSTVLSADPPLVTSDVDFQFRFSPDGRSVAYLADQESDEVVELYVVPTEGGPSTKLNAELVSGGNVFVFLWSPDGSQLAYWADQDTVGVAEAYVVSATGGPVTRLNDDLPPGGGVVFYPWWSPDGSRLAYLADQATDEVVELWTVPPTGGGATRVNGDLVAGGNVTAFVWSPDGSRLAYIADQVVDEVFELWVASADGANPQRVSGDLVPGGDVTINFSWSPDGTRLAYVADQDTDGVEELYVVAATGGGATRVNDDLVAGGDISNFRWSPDGSRLNYVADQDTDQTKELYVVSASGGGTLRLNGDLVASGDVLSGRWTSDGASIVYQADQNTDGVDELFLVPAGGGEAVRLSDPANGDIGFDQEAPGGGLWSYQAGSPATELWVVSAPGAASVRINDPLVAGGNVAFHRWSPLGTYP